MARAFQYDETQSEYISTASYAIGPEGQHIDEMIERFLKDRCPYQNPSEGYEVKSDRNALGREPINVDSMQIRIRQTLATVILPSYRLLKLLDEDGQPVITRNTLGRAINFLESLATEASDRYKIIIDLPNILPGPDQSIDLLWDICDDKRNYELLINIPADSNETPSYYGDDRNGSYVRGSFSNQKNRRLLLAWLATQV
jgi:hypothetical protein